MLAGCASDADDADSAAGEDGSVSEDAPQDAAVGPFATVTWDGTSDECSSVSCRDAAVLGQFQMLAAEGDSPTLTVLIEYPGGDAITGVTASADGASGSLTLGPDEDTAAPQINPEGGGLDFELACG